MKEWNIKLCLALDDSVISRLRSIVADIKYEEQTQYYLMQISKKLAASGNPTRSTRARIIETHIEELIDEYSGEYPLYESRVLLYASQHKKGIENQLLTCMNEDKFWTKFNS